MIEDTYKNVKSEFVEGASTVLRIQENKSNGVTITDGNIVSNVETRHTGLSARVFKDGMYGFSSFTDITAESAKRAVNEAANNAKTLAGRIERGSSFVETESGIVIPKSAAKSINNSILLEKCRELYEYIDKKYTNLITKSVWASQNEDNRIIYTSDAADGQNNIVDCRIGVYMATEDNDGNTIDVTKMFNATKSFADTFNETEWMHEEIDRYYNMLMDKKSVVYAEAGLKTVILGNQMTGILAHEAVGHTVEADLVQGGSVAGKCLNKQVASDKITMVDFANSAFGENVPTPIYIDDEGVIAGDVTLIKNGILTGYMNDRERASAFGMKALGNARAQGYGDDPLIRMRNTTILPGNDSLEDMISSVEDGYYLIESGNGEADFTGEFMFSITLGYEIKNGKIGRAIKETTVSGIAFDMLKTAEMVSDRFLWVYGSCGKGQLVVVGMGGPDVKCKINIGGR